jgi:hypothetical protein
MDGLPLLLMVAGVLSSVCLKEFLSCGSLLIFNLEHTMLVTKDGVEVLTARLPNSPGGPPSQEILDNLGIKFNDL